MASARTDTEARFGFLTAIERDPDGWVGGLLVTSRLGRPLEFQCTTPVRANRTQEVLFGNTLRPYLLGELIAKTLLTRVDTKPTLVLTDGSDLLAVRPHVQIPVLYVPTEAGKLCSVSYATLQAHEDFASDLATVTQIFQDLPKQVDLTEPLQRVREALAETVRPGAVA